MKLLIFSIGLALILMQSCVQPAMEKEERSEPVSFDTLDYSERGFELVLATKQQLSNNLVAALTEQGTDYALGSCSVKANVLTDSMANVMGATIRRVSDKNRNPQNAANQAELEYINAAHLLLARGEKLTPQVQEIDEKMVGYYPIMTNAMCLQCHGIPNEQIKPATLEKIAALYPDDKATGYGENELRGIWVVEMTR